MEQKNSTHTADFDGLLFRLASPEEIISWSHGEVTKPETINYRTAKPERDGLFDERIFGPIKDWECYCGKYRRIRYKGIICDRCGVEVTRSIVRRERMGHIKLAVPVSHIWFLRGIPSKIGLILDISVNDLEKIVYFAGYIITKVDEEARKKALEEIEREFKLKSKDLTEQELTRLKEAKETTKNELKSISLHKVLSEVEYHKLSRKFGEVFEASTGAEPLWKIMKGLNLEELAQKLEKEINDQPPVLQRKTLRRLKTIKRMLAARIRPEWMFLEVLPVIPPDLRPMVQLDGGRYATSDLNDLYRRVINRNNRLKKLYELNAPEVITRNEKRMLQEAVDALIDNSMLRGTSPVSSRSQKRPLKSLADILKGKQGRFRQNLLGKRVDYSGRSVIVVGPELKLDECGIPKKMALELFKPFVIRKLIEKELAHNIRGASRLIEDQDSQVWAALEEVIQSKYVLLNRAPTLHRLGVQAFKPVLIEGDAIQIHPLVCPAFNADFDGDQMAVHLPLTEEAQTEAREIMLSVKNLLKPATGDPIVDPTKDMVLGCYYATKFSEGAKGEGRIFESMEEAVLAYEFGIIDLQAKIKVRIPAGKIAGKEDQDPKENVIIETSTGRILFNRLLPKDFPFVNQELRSRDVAGVVAQIIKRYGIAGTPEILDKIKNFGFYYATYSGISWGIDDLRTPPEKEVIVAEAQDKVSKILEYYQDGLLTNEERYNRIIEIWQDVVNRITELVPKALDPQGPIYSMVDSKARGSWFQIRQMSGMKGLVMNPAFKIIELPVISSYKEGLNVLEYFISTHGARKGTADTALRTSVAGYLTRRLVDVAQDVIITEKDCKPKRGLEITLADSEEINYSLGRRGFGRILFEDVKDEKGKILIPAGTIIEREQARIINEKKIEKIKVRSPLTCEGLEGICQACYGYDLGNNTLIKLGEAVGIVAAQSIGEPGTQLTMRTFHTGGVAVGGDITTGLPRVEEIFEARPPRSKAVVSEVDGEVTEIFEEGREKIVRIKTELSPEQESDNQTDSESGAKKSKKKSKGFFTKMRLVSGDIREFRIPSSINLLVEKGTKVRKGDLLSEGHADLHELFMLAGREATERYIIKEVQKIYALQGAPIHDKHVEVIIRQMFSRIRIKDPGDSNFTQGEIVERQFFKKKNLELVRNGKKPATASQLLLGITRVALTTSSVLSAASFQETARILIDAAILGKKDELRGLKENVIIGRLIPAGTGFRKKSATTEKKKSITLQPAPTIEKNKGK